MQRSMQDNETRIREQLKKLGRPTEEMLGREIARCERNDGYRRLIFSILMYLIVAAAIIITVTNLTMIHIDETALNLLLVIPLSLILLMYIVYKIQKIRKGGIPRL